MDMHDGLERAGEAQTRDSAERLGSADVRALLDSRVRRGRRRRDAGIGTVAAVAVGAIALGAANLPGWGGGTANPAASPWDVEPTPGGDYEVAESAFNLQQGSHMFECGTVLEDAAPVVIHDEAVLDRQLKARATLDVAEVLQAADASPVWAVETSEGPGDGQLMWSAATAVVQGDGVVVGVAPASGWSGDGNPLLSVSQEDEVVAPLPGECETPAAQLDGTYTQVYVVQVADFNKFRPLATFTFTQEVTYEGLADYWKDQGVTFGEQPQEPEGYVEPEGDVYTAYLVPRPEVNSCTPLIDQRAEGQPGTGNIRYQVTIPGVQPLTGEIWGNAPAVVIDDPNYDAWYVGRTSAITADEVSDGNPTATVGWTTGTTWSETDPPGTLRLINHDGAQGLGEILIDGDCGFYQPIPVISGAVWLVIDGVDWETVEREYPTMSWATTDLLTWVYLGQAE